MEKQLLPPPIQMKHKSGAMRSNLISLEYVWNEDEVSPETLEMCLKVRDLVKAPNQHFEDMEEEYLKTGFYPEIECFYEHLMELGYREAFRIVESIPGIPDVILRQIREFTPSLGLYQAVYDKHGNRIYV